MVVDMVDLGMPGVDEVPLDPPTEGAEPVGGDLVDVVSANRFSNRFEEGVLPLPCFWNSRGWLTSDDRIRSDKCSLVLRLTRKF